MKNIIYRLLIILSVVGFFYACDPVEDGIEVTYDTSDANFNINLLTLNRGAIGDSVSYSVSVEANSSIKSLFVETSVSGSSKGGFYLDTVSVDPFIDHSYGTIQSGVSEINLAYNYVVAQDTTDAQLIFTLVDETGIKRDTQKVVTVPGIKRYSGISLYAKSNLKADGFSTSDGTVYNDLTQYEELTTANQAIQESLDIVFLISGTEAVLAAPYDGTFSTSMDVRNKTVFKVLSHISETKFNALTNASLAALVENKEVKSGSTAIESVKVGNVIGFRTDYSSANSYKYGVLLVTALHPTSVDHYDGVSYVIEFDVAVQQD